MLRFHTPSMCCIKIQFNIVFLLNLLLFELLCLTVSRLNISTIFHFHKNGKLSELHSCMSYITCSLQVCANFCTWKWGQNFGHKELQCKTMFVEVFFAPPTDLYKHVYKFILKTKKSSQISYKSTYSLCWIKIQISASYFHSTYYKVLKLVRTQALSVQKQSTM